MRFLEGDTLVGFRFLKKWLKLGVRGVSGVTNRMQKKFFQNRFFQIDFFDNISGPHIIALDDFKLYF